MDTAVKSSPITLYACAVGPHCAIVNCILDYKHLEFNVIHVDPVSRGQIGFTGQRHLPVLRIGEHWRTDSTHIALWLEELYPRRPVLGASPGDRLAILELHRWVTDSVLPAMLRRRLERRGPGDTLRTGWRLAAVLHRARRLPRWRRLAWPWYLRGQRRMPAAVDRFRTGESLEAMAERICRECLEQLRGGPFLGGRECPSLADLAVYPQLVADYLLGLGPAPLWQGSEPLRAWLRRVQAELPGNPLLAPDDCLVNPPPG